MVVADMKTSETDVDVTEKDMEVAYCGESIQKTEEVYRLPDNKADYMRMTVAEKFDVIRLISRELMKHLTW